MANVKKATALFAEGFNCSQAVFSAFAPSLGVNADTALKIASGFGDGIATLGEACGAVTGAVMVLGLKYGYISTENKEWKRQTYDLVKEFTKKFKDRNGSILCRQLLCFDGEMPEELKLAAQMNCHHTACPKFVRDAAEIVSEMIHGLPEEPESWDAEQKPGGGAVRGPFGG